MAGTDNTPSPGNPFGYEPGSDIRIRYAAFCELNELWRDEQQSGTGWEPYFVLEEEAV